MQRKMVHYFFTKKIIFIFFLFSYFKSILLFNIQSFKGFLQNAKSKKLGKPHKYFDPDQIYILERKISRKLGMKKCLISAHCIHIVFKKFGIENILHIGISVDGKKESHAWISTKQKKYFLSRNDEFNETMRIS